MKNRNIILILSIGLLLFSSCITTSYVPRQSGMIKTMPKGYQRENEFYKRGIFKGGIINAVKDDEKALRYAKRSSSNAKTAFGLLWGGWAISFTGMVMGVASSQGKPTYNAGMAMFYGGLLPVFLSLIPSANSWGYEFDAVNAYNDNFLQKNAPQVFDKMKK